MVTLPTQSSGNTLDLLISSKPESIIHVDQKEYFVPSCDHNMIEFKLYRIFSMNVKTLMKGNFFVEIIMVSTCFYQVLTGFMFSTLQKTSILKSY